MGELILYFMENMPNGTISVFQVKFSERYIAWKERPNAKEISWKEYNALVKTLSNPATNPKLLKTNK